MTETAAIVRPARRRPVDRPANLRVGTRKSRRRLITLIIFGVLLAGSVMYLVPFFWMLSTSLKTPDQVYEFPVRWLPNPVDWANYVEIFYEAPLWTYLGNTVFITVVGVFGSVLSAALAAYGFARFRFRFREPLFLIMLATMMVPIWVTIVPSYIIMGRIGWIDTYLPLLVPAFFAAPFNTFLLRQFFLSIPIELDEAARIDGAGTARILFQVIIPLAKPALLIVGLNSFLAYWNDYIGPLIFLQSQELFPISLGISNFVSAQSQNFPYMMAASMISMLPCILLFFVAQKWFIQGVVVSGVKG